jgi:hypothetical protein
MRVILVGMLMVLAACGAESLAPLPEPADPMVWRMGAPCSLRDPNVCGPAMVCAYTLTSQFVFCSVQCSTSTPCPTGADCTDAGLCVKQCRSDIDCSPGAICNGAGCVPDCRAEPWVCAGAGLLCRRDGRCS